jgi:hypothetical protein
MVEEPLEHVGDPLSHGGVITVGEFGVWDESLRDDAFMLEMDGQQFVCPRHPRIRMLEGLLAFRNAFLGPTALSLIPEDVAERAASELSRIQNRFPGVRSHILTSPFFVPLRWFAAFDSAERALESVGDNVTIRYRTRLRRAVDRLRRTEEVLRSAGFDDAIVDQVSDVLRWVEAFPEESVLELDYGGVAGLFSAADLALDESAAEVNASIDALAEDDFDRAGDHYAAVATRWAHAQSLGYAN